MIILDDQEQVPKLPDPVYAAPVNRCSTPTSTTSLPDYDTSQAEQIDKPWLRKRKTRYWKIVVIILLVYTLLTVVIGVPLIVVVRVAFFFPSVPRCTYFRYPPETTQFCQQQLVFNDAMESTTS